MSEIKQVETNALPPVIAGAGGFWQKNKSWIIPLLISILSALGGGVATNPQSIGSALPDVYGVGTIKTQVNDLDSRVKSLEKSQNFPFPSPPPEGGVIQVH